MLPRVPRCIILSYISDGGTDGNAAPGPHQTRRVVSCSASVVCPDPDLWHSGAAAQYYKSFKNLSYELCVFMMCSRTGHGASHDRARHA